MSLESKICETTSSGCGLGIMRTKTMGMARKVVKCILRAGSKTLAMDFLGHSMGFLVGSIKYSVIIYAR